MARNKAAGGGAQVPLWIVTFADLLAILMCFFVLILSFSTPEEKKLQVVAGSMREAFGMTQEPARTAVIERDGNPERPFYTATHDHVVPVQSRALDGDEDTQEAAERARAQAEADAADRQRQEALTMAAASLRQAWRELPEITAIEDNLILEETEDGLDILLTDQEGRPMFPEGSKYPYEATRRALVALAPVLARLPNPIRISGHTAAGATYLDPRYGSWELSFDRANEARRVLEDSGLPPARIQAVTGRAETEPYFADDPYLAANQRVRITLVHDRPALPPELF